jgi:alpha-glucosidase
MKTSLRVCLALFLLTATCLASAEILLAGNMTNVKTLSDGLELSAGKMHLRITVLAPTVVRLRYSIDGSGAVDDPFAVLPNAFPAPSKVHISDAADFVICNTGALQVKLWKKPLRVSFLDAAGNVISEDSAVDSVQYESDAFQVRKSMPINEHYFGLGDKAGPIDHREQAYTMWNTDAYGWKTGSDPLYKSIPFLLATRHGKAYGIFLDNTYRSSFDFGKKQRDVYSFGAEAGPLDYYFFYGPEPKQVLDSYTRLVGRTPLPPRFTLGYQQSRYTYTPEARVREVAQTFRDHHIPCDALYLDIDYQDGNRPFTINRTLFPNFEGMVHDLGAQGFKMVLITDLHLKKEVGYKPYDEGKKNDLFVKNPDGSDYVGKVWPGDSVFLDFARAQARELWGTLYTDFVRMGVRGFWNDMNEPSIFLVPSKTMPLDLVHSVEGRRTDHREIHNVFGMENVRATHDGLLRLSPNQRPFVLTRAAFAGTQRYAATWTGDNDSTWEHMSLTVPTLLSLGISGYPLTGADVGGFAGSPTPEVLTRWTEVATFQPIFRNHSEKQTRPHEPWVDGPEQEAIRKRYIEERYRLLPYIYTSMEETSRTGVPLMRPMFMEFPAEEKLEANDNEFMFGSDLLVAPKQQDTASAYEVKFPAGIWYDYWTGLPVKGSQIRVDPSISELPVYVRGGAIVPKAPVVQNVDQVPEGPLELDVYAGPDCQGSLYVDDGETLNYTRGEYLRQDFTCNAQADRLSVRLNSPSGNFQPWWKSIEMRLAGAPHAPANVTVDGNPMTRWHFEDGSKSVMLEVPRTASEIDVQY